MSDHDNMESSQLISEGSFATPAAGTALNDSMTADE